MTLALALYGNTALFAKQKINAAWHEPIISAVWKYCAFCKAKNQCRQA